MLGGKETRREMYLRKNRKRRGENWGVVLGCSSFGLGKRMGSTEEGHLVMSTEKRGGGGYLREKNSECPRERSDDLREEGVKLKKGYTDKGEKRRD